MKQWKIFVAFAAIFLVSHLKYVTRSRERAFFLGALRLRVAYRRLVEEHRRCLPRAAFDRPPLKSLLRDPGTGDPVELVELEPGHLWIVWPDATAGPGDRPPRVVVRCPY